MIKKASGTRSIGSEVGVDLGVEYAVTKQFSVAIRGNNVLDDYPDLLSADISYFGNLPSPAADTVQRRLLLPEDDL